MAQKCNNFILLNAKRHLVDGAELAELFRHVFELDRVTGVKSPTRLTLSVLWHVLLASTAELKWLQKLLLGFIKNLAIFLIFLNAPI